MSETGSGDFLVVSEKCNLYIKDNVLYYEEGAVKLEDIVEVRVDSLVLSYLAIILVAAIFGFLILGALAMILLSPMLLSGKVIVKTVGGSEFAVCYGGWSDMEKVKERINYEIRRVMGGGIT